jgi:hypothetical protein
MDFKNAHFCFVVLTGVLFSVTISSWFDGAIKHLYSSRSRLFK